MFVFFYVIARNLDGTDSYDTCLASYWDGVVTNMSPDSWRDFVRETFGPRYHLVEVCLTADDALRFAL
jgi:hypothetical protein